MIQEKELKVMAYIKFENNRYVVKLLFKENIPFVLDNYDVSLNRLSKLKNWVRAQTLQQNMIK